MREGFKPDFVAYNIISNAFCKLGNIDHAIRTLDQDHHHELYHHNLWICKIWRYE